jgi:hypothetical protein
VIVERRRRTAPVGRLRRPRRPVVAVGYTAVLLLGAIALALCPADVRQWVLSSSSTDVAHLTRDPWFVLPLSALWVSVTTALLYWIPVAVLTIAAVETTIGTLLTLVVVVSVHVIATVVSEGLLALRVLLGAAAPASLEVVDVGPSYVVLAAAGAAFVLLPWRRAVLVVVLIAPILTATARGLPGLDVDAIGHVLSLVLGASAAAGINAWRRRHADMPVGAEAVTT